MRVCAPLTLLLATVIATTPVASTAADPPRTVDIAGTDEMKYSVTTITAKPAMAHNVVVLKPGVDILELLREGAPHRATDFIAPNMMSKVIAKTPLAGPGEMVQVVFTVPGKPGKYPYICTFAGHYQAGMKGTLLVK